MEFCREKLATIIERMGFGAKAEARIREDGHILLEIVGGEDLGLLIGKEGNTLRALQTILRVLVVKRFDKKAMLILDADNYLLKREEALIDTAYAAVERVEKTLRKVQLKPMNSVERRIIHMTLANEENVHTYSVGEGADRRVVIAPGKVRSQESFRDTGDYAPEAADDSYAYSSESHGNR